MYLPRFFTVQEFVPPEIFNIRGEGALQLIDSRIPQIADQLRAQFGPVIFNTWHSSSLQKKYGRRTESVLRLAGTKTGATFSQHLYGRAGDALFADTSAEEVRKFVLANPSKFPFITALESGVSWFHFDVRNCTPIMVFAG